MAKKKQQAFLLEKNQKVVIDELTNEEAGKLIKAIYEYEETGREPFLEKTLKIIFKQFKIRLDMYDEAYREKCAKNKANAEKRWTDTNVCDRMRMDANKKKIKRKENKKEGERENSLSSEKDSRAVPTLADVLSYASEKGFHNREYCETFFEHYEAIGWVNGSGVQIKNWKLIFNNWLKKDKIKIEQNHEYVDEAGFTHRNGRRIL